MSKVIFNGIELNGTQALPELTYAEYDALSVKPEYWILKDDALSEDYVEVVADGVKSHATLLDELLALIDASKIGRNSVLVYALPNGNVNYCHIDRDTLSNGISFSNTIVGLSNNNVVDYYFILKSGGCKYKERVNGSVTDNSTNAPTSGAKYTLYYNTATLGQINTKAENCIYGNSNVKDALDDISAATVSSSTYPTYNAQFASEFSSGSPDNLALYTLSNGMRVMNGMFLVTAQATAADKLFDIPDSYSYLATGYLGQNWLSAVNVVTQESYTIRVNNKAYPWGADIPVGTYRIHAVF